jgi:anti-sigma regulatory factor (Ser/Thr protein kinase)
VTLQRRARPPACPRGACGAGPGDEASGDGPWRTVATWTVPSVPGTERGALEQVAAAVQLLALPATHLERLTTAVAEAVANAIEHGNQNRPELPVRLTVLVSPTALCVRVTDQGGGRPIPAPGEPDLAAKLAGEQTPRGWGLFLIIGEDVVRRPAHGERGDVGTGAGRVGHGQLRQKGVVRGGPDPWRRTLMGVPRAAMAASKRGISALSSWSRSCWCSSTVMLTG